MEKDITTNDLIDNCDVFADIANVNLFGGRCQIAPKDLETVPTDSSYKDLEGQHHRLFRDALKKVHGLGGCIGFLGYESQTGINNAMPVRDMGYTYTSYAGQVQKIIAGNRKKADSAYSKVLHEGQRLAPVSLLFLRIKKAVMKFILITAYHILLISDNFNFLSFVNYHSNRDTHLCFNAPRQIACFSIVLEQYLYNPVVDPPQHKL